MRPFNLLALAIAAATVSCWSQPNRLPEGIELPPLTDGAAGTGQGRPSEGGQDAADAAGMGPGGSGGGSTSNPDGNQVIDADQPDGGCGTPGKTCLGVILSVCDPNGVQSSTSCAHGCDPSRLECFQCTPNSRSCAGADLMVCNADGTGTAMMPCTSGCDPARNDCRNVSPPRSGALATSSVSAPRPVSPGIVKAAS
jgi:hypothetical protein